MPFHLSDNHLLEYFIYLVLNVDLNAGTRARLLGLMLTTGPGKPQPDAFLNTLGVSVKVEPGGTDYDSMGPWPKQQERAPSTDSEF